MNSYLPPPLNSAHGRPRPRALRRWVDDTESQAIIIGIVGTLLLHLALWPLFLLAEKYGSDPTESVMAPNSSSKTFNIEINNEEFKPQKMIKPPAPKPPPMKFVETNPDAPDNEPDKTNNFSSQNQQAAQEKAPKVTGGDRPEMEGKKDIESTQIIDGRLTQTNEPPVPPAPPETQEAQAPQPSSPLLQREQNPLPGLEKKVGDDKNAYGSNIAKIAPHPEDVPNHVDGVPNAPENQNPTPPTYASVNPRQPKPRPQLDRKARPALFAENKIGTSNIGPAAVDARWSNYGVYLQKMIETVQIQWNKLIMDGRTYPASGSLVMVKFIMDSEGSIVKIVNVESGLAGPQAEGYCLAAITKPSPYGKWSEDMVAVLGNQQEMTFSFYYQ